jgi:hypothetical protein
MVVADMKTTYQVGKGMLAHVEEMARQAEAAAAEPVPDEGGGEPVAMAETEEVAPETRSTAAPPSGETPADEAPEMTEETPLPARRRMRFAFDHSAGATA